MSWILLVVALFFAPGQSPKPYVVVLVPGVECNGDVAAAYVKHITNGVEVDFNYSCDKATESSDLDVPVEPTEKHTPGKNEAANEISRPKV